MLVLLLAAPSVSWVDISMASDSPPTPAGAAAVGSLGVPFALARAAGEVAAAAAAAAKAAWMVFLFSLLIFSLAELCQALFTYYSLLDGITERWNLNSAIPTYMQ